MVRPLRLVGAVLCGRWVWCDGIHPGGRLLCRTCAAGVGAAGLVVRTGVDSVVRNDGGVGLVGVAAWQPGGDASGAGPVRAAADAQWLVELAVLCVAVGSLGVGRHRGAVAGVGRNDRRVRQAAATGGVVIGAVSGVGELRSGAQLFGLATQPSGAWLIFLLRLLTCTVRRCDGDHLLLIRNDLLLGVVTPAAM